VAVAWRAKVSCEGAERGGPARDRAGVRGRAPNEDALYQLNILQTVVFFRPHTRSVHEAHAGPALLEPDPRQFEFLMVKLLRVYGECLGTKSR
jgi:hypothetical protein